MMSRWPSVVSMPTVAPFRSSNALVATVVPCTIRSVSARNRRRSSETSAASKSSPSITPIEGSEGVEADFANVTCPSSSTATRSVNVPPTSIPMRNTSATLSRPRGAWPPAVLPVHEPVLMIRRACRLVTASRIAITSASRRVDEEHGPWQDRNADLLGLEFTRGSSRDHSVAVGQTVAAAQDAVRGMPHSIACRIALRGRGRFHAQFEDGPHSTAKASVAGRAGPELVLLEEEGEACLGHLDAAELDPAGGLSFARRLPSVAGRRRAASATCVEQVPDERPLRPGIHALDRDAEST